MQQKDAAIQYFQEFEKKKKSFYSTTIDIALKN